MPNCCFCGLAICHGSKHHAAAQPLAAGVVSGQLLRFDVLAPVGVLMLSLAANSAAPGCAGSGWLTDPFADVALNATDLSRNCSAARSDCWWLACCQTVAVSAVVTDSTIQQQAAVGQATPQAGRGAAGVMRHVSGKVG